MDSRQQYKTPQEAKPQRLDVMLWSSAQLSLIATATATATASASTSASASATNFFSTSGHTHTYHTRVTVEILGKRAVPTVVARSA
ncbi:hypothetical protein HYFRA_00011884 [Hymenoscyphus fraxineus]|uniref:Uncharacterized protein n=1 Tax=Hymenoscyphus fraxineus TaxID=746836 RepID=A0A9N9L1S2_9HELO|nr:hypothetical protein HYFRA_00011884 [Hymenoscyphus fraxineus]